MIKQNGSTQIVSLLGTLSLIGCVSGGGVYTPPSMIVTPVLNIRTYHAPIDQVWQALTNHTSQNFFVVDNITKDSYFMNLSFSASDPTQYIDCGTISSHVKNLRGDRTYTFPSAAAYQQYEVVSDGNLYGITRRIGLTGKINVFLTKQSDTTTSARVNVRYVVSREFRLQDVAGHESAPVTAVLGFGSGETGTGGNGAAIISCHPTGAIESNILDGINGNLPK